MKHPHFFSILLCTIIFFPAALNAQQIFWDAPPERVNPRTGACRYPHGFQPPAESLGGSAFKVRRYTDAMFCGVCKQVHVEETDLDVRCDDRERCATTYTRYSSAYAVAQEVFFPTPSGRQLCAIDLEEENFYDHEEIVIDTILPLNMDITSNMATTTLTETFNRYAYDFCAFGNLKRGEDLIVFNPLAMIRWEVTEVAGDMLTPQNPKSPDFERDFHPSRRIDGEVVRSGSMNARPNACSNAPYPTRLRLAPKI